MLAGCTPTLLDQLLPALLHNMALAEEDLEREAVGPLTSVA